MKAKDIKRARKTVKVLEKMRKMCNRTECEDCPFYGEFGQDKECLFKGGYIHSFPYRWELQPLDLKVSESEVRNEK